MTYIKKVEIFESGSAGDLEGEVNDFISKEIERGFSVLDIQYQTACTYDSMAQTPFITFSCMVYYSEPVEE